MQTSWRMSRRIAPDTRDRRVGPLILGRRATTAWLLAGVVLGMVLLNGCGTGDGGGSATRPSTERSGTRPTPSATESPNETATAPTRPTPTSAETPPPTRTPTSAEALPPTSTPTSAGTPASAESQGLGALGWFLLIVLVVGLVAGWMIFRSRRKSAWDAKASALEQDTRATTSTQLPPVLTAETAGQRALVWPPLRAALVDLMRRWDLLAEGAPDDQRQRRSGQIGRLLQELLAALDAESEALATGRDWRLLRPRVDESGRALSAVLAGVPQQEPEVARERLT